MYTHLEEHCSEQILLPYQNPKKILFAIIIIALWVQMQGAASSAPTSKTGFCRDAACDHARQVRFMVKTLHPFARIEMCNKCVYTEDIVGEVAARLTEGWVVRENATPQTHPQPPSGGYPLPAGGYFPICFLLVFTETRDSLTR